MLLFFTGNLMLTFHKDLIDNSLYKAVLFSIIKVNCEEGGEDYDKRH